MTEPRFARLALESPLPQLDRLFDYRIPEAILGQIRLGNRVKVPFGHGKKLLDGFVVELADKASFEGKVADIADLVSAVPALQPEIYKLARAVADRQAATLGDVLKLAVPSRAVAVEKKWFEALQPAATEQDLPNLSCNLDTWNLELDLVEPASKHAVMVPPAHVFLTGVGQGIPENLQHECPSWVALLLINALALASQGKTSIIVLPDFRDQALFTSAASAFGLGELIVDYSSQLTKPNRYANFLATLAELPRIIVGSRSALYAPAHNLGGIFIWDDGDSSHVEPTSPYSHSREVALIRQSQAGCALLIASHSRSTEVARLIQIGYLHDASTNFATPKIAITESSTRIDGLAWRTIRESLERGAVLVQVASRGSSVSAYCNECSERARCNRCNGPIWVDSNATPKCRWCNALNLNHECQVCKSKVIRQGRAGATRTATEFGKAFAGAYIVESNGSNRLETVKPGKRIVIATPGAEPRVAGGYAAVILLDCNELLGRDTLKASEDAVRAWSNAVALMASQGLCVAVGIKGRLANQFALWSQFQIAAEELANRAELNFPPAVRLASVSGPLELIEKVLTPVKQQDGFDVLGPLKVEKLAALEDDWRFLIRFSYSSGAKLAAELKAESAVASSGQKRVSASSGRASRPIRIKMDEPEVI
jgi:primosomal protein N' (replication factor Y)